MLRKYDLINYRIFIQIRFLLLLVLLILSNYGYSQIVNTPTRDTIYNTVDFKSNPVPNVQNHSQEIIPKDIGLLSTFEFALSIAVLCFGLLIILLEIYLVKSKKISSETLVKFIVVTLIITGTLFLITAGYNNNQIAPAAGLFGTIAGYLLGKSSIKKEDNEC